MRVAVLGGGNGGCACAGHLALNGHRVRLFSRNSDIVRTITESGGLQVEGPIVNGRASLEYCGNDLSAAVDGADVVMLVVPATAHDYYARHLAPLLDEDQVVFLNPGHTGGAFHFSHVARRHGLRVPFVTEANTLTYACRLVGPARIAIYNVAPVLVATLPSRYGGEAYGVLQDLYEGITRAAHVLETSLVNLNAVLHPPGMLLNAGWIERVQGEFYYYYEGTTPSVGTLMEALDAERRAVAEAYGVASRSFLDYFCESGYTTVDARDSGSFYRALRESAANRWVKAPQSIDHRYLNEDVPYGLVPMSELAGLAGVKTPVMDALIALCGVLVRRDYWSEGLTLDRMGLSGMTAEDLLSYVVDERRRTQHEAAE